MGLFIVFLCIISTFTLLLLVRIIFMYYLFRTWNHDLMEYCHCLYCFGDPNAKMVLDYKQKIGLNIFHFEKWLIKDFVKDDLLIEAVNKFIKKQKLQHYMNWHNYHE